MKLRLAAMVAVTVLTAAPEPGETTPSMETVKREIHLEKRARLAIRYARATVSRVEALYREGNRNEGAALLLEIQEAVELANESLQATGKPAWKKSKPFKVVEIATRKLLRDLDDLDKKLSFNERDQLLAVRTRIEQLNQKLLMAIMTKKRKK